MTRTGLIAAGIALAASDAAPAAVLDFSGTMTATASVGGDATCSPVPLRGVIAPQNSSGHSNLGDFAYSHSICISGGVGPISGTYLIDFGGDQFSGNVTGMASASSTPGVFDQVFNYTILGGTGRFLGASGAFTGLGTVDPRMPPPKVNFTFDGDIDAPAVPEPASWAMLIAGFGAMGAALRRRDPTRVAA